MVNNKLTKAVLDEIRSTVERRLNSTRTLSYTERIAYAHVLGDLTRITKAVETYKSQMEDYELEKGLEKDGPTVTKETPL